MIGTEIGHYKIETKLGEGGMGVVYKALDTKLNRPVALKFLPSHVSEAEKDKERFVQEAQAAASLSHANICTIFGIEDVEGKQFIVMEYVDGQTLQEKKQNLPLKQALEIGIQIADGLAAAHDKGIVHRDIKPENIMIKKDGTVQIMDFGLAKLRGATRLTKEGSTVGTVGYMSPEQVQGLDVDHRTDIFSLGVLLYEMIAGQSPFKGVHETAITYEIVNVDPPPIGTIKPEIDAELDAIVLDCVAKDPADRYQSAAEVARNLRRVKRESSRSRVSRITGSRAAYVPPASADGTRFTAHGSRFTSILPWALAGALTVLTAIFAWFSLAGSSVPQRELRLAVLPPEGVFFGRRGGGHLAISPDGSMIAFVGVDSARSASLYVRALNDATPRKLPGTEGAQRPFWSPDNRWIGFETSRSLKKIDIMGGSPLTICDLNASQGATWNGSAQIVYNGFAASSGLWVVSANGGESHPLMNADTTTLVNSASSSRWPWFLPDGEHFLFTLLSVGGVLDGKIMVGSLSSPDRKELLNARSNAQYADGHIFFYRDNKLIAQPFDPDALELTGDPIPLTEDPTYDPNRGRADFSVSNDGTIVQTTGSSDGDVVTASTLWLDREGTIIDGPQVRGEIAGLRLSPDGSHLALVEGVQGFQDIWIYNVRRNVRSRLTFGAGPENYPAWSPDGRTVFFTSFQLDGNIGMYRKDAMGLGTEEQLRVPEGRERTSRVSPDGRHLFYLLSTSGGRDDIYALPLQGNHTPVPVVTNSFDNEFPDVSPDGRWVAYPSNETGVFQIYVVPFPPTGSRWQISSGKENARAPRWRGDGKELFYLSGSTIQSVPIETKGDVLFPGTPRTLFESPSGGNPWGWDVTSDGKRFVSLDSRASSDPANDPLLVVMNWRKDW